MAEATVFNDDPAAQARAFAAQGFSLPAHRRPQRRLRRQAGQRAGGRGHPRRRRPCRCSSAAASATSTPSRRGSPRASRRVILGTVAVRDPGLVREACRRFPGPRRRRHRRPGGKVAVEGWAETSELDAIELARRFEGAGVAAIIYTDIDRDGVLTGLNLPATAALARAIVHSRHRLGRPRRHRRHRGAAAAGASHASKAPSPAARSTTAASMPGRRSL